MAKYQQGYGLCECGCGGAAPIAQRTNRRLGYVKGQPGRYIIGHNRKAADRDLAERFWEKVEKRGADECWPWLGALEARGYGRFKAEERVEGAHRVAYRLGHGQTILKGFDIDHLCRNRACVNPAHLEAVPHRINILRGETTPAANADKTHCKQGHPLSGDNLYVCPRGRRNCRECRRQANRRSQARAKTRAA